MKRCVMLLCLVFTYTYSSGQIRPINAGMDVKGNVKSFTKVSYEAIDYFGKLKKVNEENRVDVYDLDDKNRFVKRTRTEGGVFISERRAFYSSGKNFEKITVLKRGDTFVYKYIFDDRGNIVEYNQFKNDTLYGKEMATYDQNDSLIHYREYGNDGKISWNKTWTYDSNGKLTEEKFSNKYGYFNHETYEYRATNKKSAALFNAKGENTSNKEFVYDQSNRLQSEITIPLTSLTSFYKTTYTYNSKGDILASIKYAGESRASLKEIRRKTYKYDSENRLILYQLKYDGRLQTKNIYKFDVAGNLILEETYYYSNDDYSHYVKSYKYDSTGNWTKKVNTYKFTGKTMEEELGVTERIFTYR